MRRWIGSLAAMLLLWSPVLAEAKAESWTRAWTSSLWATAVDQRPEVENATLRAEVRVGASGQRLRLRLANDYGPNVTIGAATVRIASGAYVPVTVDGAKNFRIPGGAALVSDPIDLPVKAFDLVTVALHLPGRVVLASVHENSGALVAISPPGDFTAQDFTPVLTSRLRPFLAGIDVETGRARPVVVAFGDSITDVGSCANDAVPVCRWSEVLGRRLAAKRKPHVVINQAISGNRVLAEGSGESALARFDRDVLAIPGVSHVVLLEGINDVGNSGLTRNGTTRPVITAAELIGGYRQLALRAREHGIKVYAMTVLPFEGAFYYAPEREAIRLEVNHWIRTARAFDAVIDMERVMADPANSARLATPLQTGDNLHPNGAGETAMGEAIDLKLFR